MDRAKTIAVAVVIIITASLISAYAYMHLISSHKVQSLHQVSLGVEYNTHATPIWVALHDNLFKKYGLNVTRVIKFKTGLDLAAAIARGEVKVAWACLGPALMIIAKGVLLRIVAKVHNYGYALVVNPKKVHSLKDLNGKVVYAPGKGSPCYLLLLKIEEEYGVKFAAIKFMKPPAMLAALLSGEIEAGAIPEPYSSVAEAKGLRVLLRAQDVWPDMPGSYLVVTEDVLRKDPELVKKLVEVTYAGIKELEKSPSRAAKIDSEVLGIPVTVAEHSIKMLQWNITVDVKQIQKYIDFMYENHILKVRLNASKIVVPVKP